MEPTPEPALPELGARNNDLVQYALRLLEALRQANADKQALREWVDDEK